MRRLRISTIMVVVAAIAVDAWLARAFVVDGMFAGLVFIVPALQVGFWRARRTRGRRRRFWLGFEVGGVLMIAGLIVLELFPRSRLTVLMTDFIGWTIHCRDHYAPERVQILFEDHEDWFFAVVYFLPTLGAALTGGLLAACVGPRAADEAPADRQPTDD